MMKAAEVKSWLESIPGDADVAVDEGGLMLVLVSDPSIYIEVGGEPEDEEEV